MTQEGVIRVPNLHEYPLLKDPIFKDQTIILEEIYLDEFEKAKKNSSIKIYFKGFSIGVTRAEVESVFGRFGDVQYVFLMKSKGGERNKCGHGYFFYSDRGQVDILLSYSGKLYSKECRIRYEEFKSTNPKKQNSKSDKAILKSKSSMMQHSDQTVLLRFDKMNKYDAIGNKKPRDERCFLKGVHRKTLNKAQPNCLQEEKKIKMIDICFNSYLKSSVQVAYNLDYSDNLRFNIAAKSEAEAPRSLNQLSNPVTSSGKSNLTPFRHSIYHLRT